MKQFSLGRNPTGLIASEKLDGVWAMVKDGRLVTKSGRVLPVPSFFYPNGTVGEVWAGHGRFQLAQSACAGSNVPVAFIPHASIPTVIVRSSDHLEILLADVMAQGGEGLVLTCPKTGDQWKVKPRHDAEAIVKAVNGQSALVQFGKISFNLTITASGVSVGDEVTFAHSGFTDSGIPRHASFLRVRLF